MFRFVRRVDAAEESLENLEAATGLDIIPIIAKISVTTIKTGPSLWKEVILEGFILAKLETVGLHLVKIGKRETRKLD